MSRPALRVLVGEADEYITHATLKLVHRRLVARHALASGHPVKADPGNLFQRAFEPVVQDPDDNVALDGVDPRFIYLFAVAETGA